MNHPKIEQAADQKFWREFLEGKLDHIRTGFQKGCDMQLLEIWHRAFRAGIDYALKDVKPNDGTTT